MVAEAAPFIRPFLASDDAVHRGHAVWALRALGETHRGRQVESLRRDPSTLPFYDSGFLREVSVAELASG
jgi:hypothetical protein